MINNNSKEYSKLSFQRARGREQSIKRSNDFKSLDKWLNDSIYTYHYVSFLKLKLNLLIDGNEVSFYDYGCGDTWLSQYLANENSLFCFDSFEKIRHIAKRNLSKSKYSNTIFSKNDDFWNSYKKDSKLKVFILHNVAEFLNEKELSYILNLITEGNQKIILLFVSSTYRRFSIHNFTTSFWGGYKKYQARIGSKILAINNFKIEGMLKDNQFKINYRGGAYLIPLKIIKILPTFFYKYLIHVKGFLSAYLSRSSVYICSKD